MKLVLLLFASLALAAPKTGIEKDPAFRASKNDFISDFSFQDQDIHQILRPLGALFGGKTVVTAPNAHVRVTIPEVQGKITLERAWGMALDAARKKGIVVQADSKFIYVFRKGGKRPKPSVTKPGAKKVLPKNGDTITVAGQKVAKALRERPFEEQAKLVPYLENNQPREWLVTGIRAGSAFEVLGIVDGDRICGLNGRETFQAELPMVLQLELGALNKGQSIELCLHRDGKKSRFTVQGIEGTVL